MTINELWHSSDLNSWLAGLKRYTQFVKPANLALEQELDPLDLQQLRAFNAQSWYDFLYFKYYRWKFTAANRLATTRGHLATYVTDNALHELHDIKETLLTLPLENPLIGLTLAKSIRGLGPAGASGLLALMYPKYFGTVDQFVIKALREVDGLSEAKAIMAMNPDNISLHHGTVLIRIMRAKAATVNSIFNCNEWTPRRVDMILWTYGR